MLQGSRFEGARSTGMLMFYIIKICICHICVRDLFQSLCMMNEVRDLHFVLKYQKDKNFS